MRSPTEVRGVESRARQGLSPATIARRSGIPSTTVRRWLEGRTPRHAPVKLAPSSYTYLLGLDLGDGHLAKFPRTLRLQIYLDSAYPGIIGECVRAIRAVLPANRVSVHRRRPHNVVYVSCYSQLWPELFPQHGAGAKHTRSIVLEDWQSAMTKVCARELVRGLIHSDGCRFVNEVRSRGRTYRYPRYTFTNRSEDIKTIFCEHLDLLGIEWRRMNAWNISVARREAVARLDEFVGPKR